MNEDLECKEKDAKECQQRKFESNNALDNYAKFIASMIEKYQSVLLEK